MPYFSFQFTNSNSDQNFTVSDLQETAKNPIFTGAVNNGDTSSAISCWKNSDALGRVQITGSIGPTVDFDITEEGQTVEY